MTFIAFIWKIIFLFSGKRWLTLLDEIFIVVIGVGTLTGKTTSCCEYDIIIILCNKWSSKSEDCWRKFKIRKKKLKAHLEDLHFLQN